MWYGIECPQTRCPVQRSFRWHPQSRADAVHTEGEGVLVNSRGFEIFRNGPTGSGRGIRRFRSEPDAPSPLAVLLLIPFFPPDLRFTNDPRAPGRLEGRCARRTRDTYRRRGTHRARVCDAARHAGRDRQPGQSTRRGACRAHVRRRPRLRDDLEHDVAVLKRAVHELSHLHVQAPSSPSPSSSSSHPATPTSWTSLAAGLFASASGAGAVRFVRARAVRRWPWQCVNPDLDEGAGVAGRRGVVGGRRRGCDVCSLALDVDSPINLNRKFVKAGS